MFSQLYARKDLHCTSLAAPKSNCGIDLFHPEENHPWNDAKFSIWSKTNKNLHIICPCRRIPNQKENADVQFDFGCSLSRYYWLNRKSLIIYFVYKFVANAGHMPANYLGRKLRLSELISENRCVYPEAAKAGIKQELFWKKVRTVYVIEILKLAYTKWRQASSVISHWRIIKPTQ